MMAKKPENDALKSACDGRKLREEEKGNGKKMSQKSLASFDRGLRFENNGECYLCVITGTLIKIFLVKPRANSPVSYFFSDPKINEL